MNEKDREDKEKNIEKIFYNKNKEETFRQTFFFFCHLIVFSTFTRRKRKEKEREKNEREKN